jgi:hypothetical protein
MSSGREAPLEAEIGDFAIVLGTGGAEDGPVIVGGHAVGLWSRYYLASGVSSLADFLPFRSKDLDLVGNMDLLESLQRRVQGRILRSEPRGPVFGRLEIPQAAGGFLRVEVLHTVLGLNKKDLGRTMNIEVEGIVGRVPFPHLVLKAKIANSALIQQDGRQDVKHVRMMLICTRAFVTELLEQCQSGKLSERAAINLLDEIREIISSAEATKAAALWNFDYASIWPLEMLQRIEADKISRWLEHRLGGSQPG